MKKTLIWLALFFAICNLQSQNINLARHSHNDRGLNMVSVNSRFFYVEQVRLDNSPDSTKVVGLNSSLQVIFEYKFRFHEDNRVRKIIRTLDNCLLIAGFADGCDYTSNNAKNFIVKLDSNGAVVFLGFLQYLLTSIPVLDEFVDFVQHADSSYYFISQTALYHYSKYGQFLTRTSLVLPIIHSLSTLKNGNLLINGRTNNVNQNIEITVTGNLVSQQNTSQKQFIIQRPDKSLFSLNMGGAIEKSDSLSTIIASTFTSYPGIIIGDFIIKNDSIFFAGRTNVTSQVVYGILDLNLNPLYFSQSSYSGTVPTGITINDQNKICVLSTVSSSVDPWVSHISLHQFPKTGSYEANLDIGVKSFSVLSSAYSASWGNYITVNVLATIKNYTNDTIKNFYLNSKTFRTMCGYYLLHKKYSVPIPPNGEIVVETGNFYQRQDAYISSPPGSVFLTDICLFTTAPNQQQDMNLSNDGGCLSLGITVTGLEDQSLERLGINVYPNPSPGLVNIDSENTIIKISITTVMGSLVREMVVNANTILLNNSDLTNGIYFLKIETDKGSVIKKVVKE